MRPKTSITKENVTDVRKVVGDDRRVTYGQIEKILGLNAQKSAARGKTLFFPDWHITWPKTRRCEMCEMVPRDVENLWSRYVYNDLRIGFWGWKLLWKIFLKKSCNEKFLYNFWNCSCFHLKAKNNLHF